MAVVRLAVTILLAVGGASATECTNYTGFLVDLYCWYQPNMIGLDGSNLAVSPQDHTVGCAVMSMCRASGFGLLTRSGSATTYSLAYAFDADTNSLALTYLNTLYGMTNGSKRKNLTVAVCGAATGSVLAGSSIVDTSGLSSVATTSATSTWSACYSGFLVDLLCWNKPGHVGFDGAPLATAPQNHTVGCLTMASCAASGYGLVTQGSGGTYDLKYTFSKAGNGLVLQYLAGIKAAGATKNVMVSVCGAPDMVDATKTNVYTITDTSDKTSVAVSATSDTDAAWPPAPATTTTKAPEASGAPAQGWATLTGAASLALLAWAPAA